MRAAPTQRGGPATMREYACACPAYRGRTDPLPTPQEPVVPLPLTARALFGLTRFLSTVGADDRLPARPGRGDGIPV